MKYAPILIPTLCRSKHFIRCIESLKKNGWAKYTDVYVALDYPAKEAHWEGYTKIKEYLQGDFSEFLSFNVIVREANYGSARNMSEMRTEILKKYDRFIRTDDDCEFSPNFIEYMDKCLEKYEKDSDVIAVTGYSYPIKWSVASDCTALKNSLIFPMWGTGFWKDKFINIKKDLESDFIGKYVRKYGVNRNEMTDARYVDCMCAATNYGNTLTKCISDIACGCYMQLTNKFIITPVVSLVRNYGFDGSGVWCQDIQNAKRDENKAQTYNYQKQKIDDNCTFELKVDDNCSFELNRKALNIFDNRDEKTIKKCEKKLKIQKYLGPFIYKKIWEIVH